MKDERDQLIKATLEIDHIPVGMEMFNAADEEQWETIKRTIDQCDYYAVIVAHRYGSIDEATGLSYTEKEYDYAVSIGVPVMGFVLDSEAAWPGDRRESDAAMLGKLAAFREKVQGKRMVNHWTNKDNLNARFAAAFPKLIVSRPRAGWVRSTEAASREMAGELVRLSRENAELREQLATAKQSVALMPDFEVSMVIVWESYSVNARERDQFGMPITTSRLVEGYRLKIIFMNKGNVSSEKAKLVLNIPWEVIEKDHEIISLDGNSTYNIIELSVRDSWPAVALGYPGRANQPILLPGEGRIVAFNLLEDYASCQAPLQFSIHPDQGYATSKALKWSDIQVAIPKPDTPILKNSSETPPLVQP